MKHINYFLNQGLTICVKNNGNLNIAGLSSLQSDARDQILQYARENKRRIIFEIETQNKSLEEKIDILWSQADKLADWIDNPTSEITWQERTKHVLTVLEMGREIDLLVDRQQDVTEKKPLPKSRPVVLNPIPVETKPAQPETCPAKCKRSGKCYGNSWFTGKAGKSSVCVPVCPWAEQLKQHYIDKKENSL